MYPWPRLPSLLLHLMDLCDGSVYLSSCFLGDVYQGDISDLGEGNEHEHLSVTPCFFKNSFIPGPVGAFCCVSASSCSADFGQARLTSKRQVLETCFS